MANEEEYFDSLLGGTEELPSALTLVKFTSFRSQEIQIMKNSLVCQSGTKLAFQTLPKHMRRRAMSHNVKRLPRRLRQIHLNQMKKSGMPAKQKRPSRKYRRRPKNLTEEYTKRSTKRFKWLQTHIWHAKRFHMMEKWGYKLPYSPCDKAFRACYRAISQHCLLQDISYVKCIEISGDKNVIIENVKRRSKSDNGLTITAKAFLQGNREGELTLYDTEEESLIQRVIGLVNYQWQPGGSDNGISKLWLWVHASYYELAKNVLCKCFNNYQDIAVEELSDELSRFRLTGPLSNAVLHDALVTLNIDNNSTQQWFKEYLELGDNNQIINNQSLYWQEINNIDSVSELSPHIIHSLIVKDPRLNVPRKRTKSIPTFKKSVECNLIGNISASPLWIQKFRKAVNENKITDAQIADLQSKLLVPGSEIEQSETLIPIILIQKPGNKKENIGLGSGWDVILPRVWAKSFWIAFVMRGARAGGLRESESVLFEMGKSQLLHPDTEAGKQEEHRTSKENREKFFRKPPNKRINYNKFKIASPFSCNWEILLKDWERDSTPTETFRVLRDKHFLNTIDCFLNFKTQLMPEYPKNCLIPVRLICEKRGSPLQYAIICLPESKNDFKHILIEPGCDDELQIKRKDLRQTHQRLLKKLRKQRKMKSTGPLSEDHKEIMKEYTKKMRALWLPESISLRYSCCREVMGFVTKGGFSYSLGKSAATGYITNNALSALLKTHFRNKVLVRNTNSRQYKVAKLSVIQE